MAFDLASAEPVVAAPKAPKVAGMLEPGNIDLTNRPRVKNPDGSISTVRSLGVNVDGNEVLIPTVSDDGKVMSDEDAIASYKKTGKHLGKFDTPANSTAYAQQLHKDQEALYAPKGGKFDITSAEPAEPTLMDQAVDAGKSVVRGVGRTARAAIKGAYSLPAIIANAGAGAYNEAANAVERLAGSEKGFRFPDQSSIGTRLADALGLPKAENASERIAEDVAEGMTGAGTMAKAGNLAAKGGTELVKRIGETLAARPGTQIVAGATGPGASSVVREEGGGPVAQTAAGLTGAFVPALPAAAAAAARGLVRGGDAGAKRILDNLDTFEQAGAGTPTIGQATEGRGARAMESFLAKTPGSAGRMVEKADEEAAGIAGKVDDITAGLTGRTGAAPAGRQIKSGLEKFVEDFKGQSGQLYDALDKHIPKDTQVGVSNTRAALEKLNADIPGAPNLSKWFKNAKIQGIEGALDKDAPATQAQPIISQILDAEGQNIVKGEMPGKVAGIPYEALKKLRTLVGNEMADSTLGSDVPRSKWKPLYAALSKDMAAAAQGAGPKAEAAYVRANNFHRSGMQRLTEVLDPIMAKGDPEDIFKAAISGTREGATTISGVMKSLPVESRKVVAGTMLKRLGLATPGKQNDLGEAFSTETFLTNWNKLHPDAKRVLFAPLEPQMRSDLDKIAAVANNVREGSKVFANPSGTTQALSNRETVGGAIIALLTGHPLIAGGIGVGVAGANVGARVMTSPKVVHWLAESTKVPVEQLPAQLNTLFQQSLYMKGDERREVRQFVKDVRAARGAAAQPMREEEGALQ